MAGGRNPILHLVFTLDAHSAALAEVFGARVANTVHINPAVGSAKPVAQHRQENWLSEGWQPATFLERGVAVPFTTPALSGARARPAERGAEIVVPNPSGGRGVYIVPWLSLGHYCALTLHDRALGEHIAALPALAPGLIRHAARLVAIRGAAGRAARDAATAAVRLEREAQLYTNITLLRRLLDQVGQPDCPLAQLEHRAKAAIRHLAASLGRPAETLTNDIEALAILYASTGTGSANSQSAGVGSPPPSRAFGTEHARCTVLMDAITLLRGELVAWSANAVASTGMAASLIIASADLTLTAARQLLVDAWARLDDLPALLAAFAANPTAIAATIVRAEWLLDGWEQICLVWRLAPRDGGSLRRAVMEMALMVPVLPKELDQWMISTLVDEDADRLRRFVLTYEDWRTGSLVFELVARNEQMRALAA